MADVLSVIQDVLNQDKQQKKEQAKIMREVNKNKNKKENSYLVLKGPSSKKKCMRLLCVYL